MRTAVIGAGAWGKNIVRTLNEMGVLEAVVEMNPTLRSNLAEAYPDVTFYDDIQSIIDSDIPAVLIAIPAPTHYKVAKAFLEAGKDVFVEKPMTLSVEESEELVRIAQENDKILMVGHLLLYQPAVKWIHNAIHSGLIGQLRNIHQKRLGLGRARDVENVLWSLGVHDVAVALYLVGIAPEKIEANGQRILQPSTEDDIYLHMTFTGGIHTHLHCSWLWPERERGLVVVGTDGMLVYNELEQTVTLHRKSIGSDLKNIDNGSETVYEGSGEPLKLEMSHFLECVTNRSKPISDGTSGVEVIRVLQTASKGLQ